MDFLITYAISIKFLYFPISLNSPLERSVLSLTSFGLVQQVTLNSSLETNDKWKAEFSEPNGAVLLNASIVILCCYTIKVSRN